MKMRELETVTGVNREVIRIMFRKGLLPEPERPARNAAQYGEPHVRAIKAVRALQENSRLTLDEIRNAIEGQTLASRNGASVYHRLEELLAVRFGIDQSPLVTIASLAERFPAAARDAKAFAAMNMLSIVDADDGPSLSLADARLVEIWGRIRSAGFVEESGFPPENIAFYRDAAELVARHEADVFLAGSAGRFTEEQGADMLHVALPLMLDFFGLLRIKSFMRNIHDAGGKTSHESSP